ncbi:MAG TPA: ABC transporter ATP-binding protein, partial [bacterium]|nr:ABC transporter ATP-binding protein [bacterium]
MKLKIKNISFSYDSVDALKNISFEAEEGEILGIIGPNGSGKTTLLKCINRVLKPKEGVVMLDDMDLSVLNQREIAQKIGVVPQQSFSQFPFTVFDIVLMGRYPYITRFGGEKKEDFDMVEECLNLCGISHLAERLIIEISGGEYQRVIIARALAQNPKVLLLDEPTLHLDINHQIELLELLKSLAKKKNLIIIMVSHDLNLASRFSDKILILKEGKIYRAGLPEEVLTPQIIKEVYGIK